ALTRPLPLSPPLPYTTLFRSRRRIALDRCKIAERSLDGRRHGERRPPLGNAIQRANQPVDGIVRRGAGAVARRAAGRHIQPEGRSEEHTSELQSRVDLVCRLL